MLDTLIVVGAALILALFCSVLILPLPDDPVPQQMDPQPNGKAASRTKGESR